MIVVSCPASRGYGKAEQSPERLSVLTEALAILHKHGECWWEAELYRLKGERPLALSAADGVKAEACFQQALDIARGQQANSLELRAVLSRRWQRQGKCTEGQKLPGEIYGCFTEGFAGPDLKEAKALLKGLSGQRWFAASKPR
jgi:predicted ATPase